MMVRPDPIGAEILLGAEVSPEQELQIVDAFGELGIAARARIIPTRRGPTEVQWVLLAMLPLQAFISTLGSKLADGAIGGLKRLVGRALGNRPETSPRAVMMLQDTSTRLQVVLEADLPADAYKALLSLDLSTFSKGPLHYDQHRGVWRSESDESERRPDSPAESS